MKRILTLSLALFILSSAFAKTNLVVLPEKPAKVNANNVLIPIGKNGEKISLMDLSLISTKEYEALVGTKMNLANKLEFKLIQKKLRSTISSDGTINSKIMGKALVKAKKADTSKTKRYLKLWLILLGLAIVLGILGWVSGFFWILSSIAGLGAVIFFILWIISMSGSI
jgi:hypothetical protein